MIIILSILHLQLLLVIKVIILGLCIFFLSLLFNCTFFSLKTLLYSPCLKPNKSRHIFISGLRQYFFDMHQKCILNHFRYIQREKNKEPAWRLRLLRKEFLLKCWLSRTTRSCWKPPILKLGIKESRNEPIEICKFHNKITIAYWRNSW